MQPKNLKDFLNQSPVPCLHWARWQELVYNSTLENKQTPMLDIQESHGIYELPTIEATNFLAAFIDYLRKGFKTGFRVHSAGCGRAVYEYHINHLLAQQPHAFSIECSDIHARWFMEKQKYRPFIDDVKQLSYEEVIATNPDVLLLFWVPPWQGSLQPEIGQPEILRSLLKDRIPMLIIVSERIDHTSICAQFHDEMIKMGYHGKVLFPKFMSTIDFKPLPENLLLNDEFIKKKLSQFRLDSNMVRSLLKENWHMLPDYANSSKTMLYFYSQEAINLEDFQYAPEWTFSTEVKEVELPNQGLMELCSLFEMLHVN